MRELHWSIEQRARGGGAGDARTLNEVLPASFQSARSLLLLLFVDLLLFASTYNPSTLVEIVGRVGRASGVCVWGRGVETSGDGPVLTSSHLGSSGTVATLLFSTPPRIQDSDAPFLCPTDRAKFIVVLAVYWAVTLVVLTVYYWAGR